MLICDLGLDGPLQYLDRRCSQFYFGRSSGSDVPFFVEESVGEPRRNHEVVNAFLCSATREVDKSLQSWCRRAASARSRQRAFSDPAEAAEHGLYAADVQLIALRVVATAPSAVPGGWVAEKRSLPSFSARPPADSWGQLCRGTLALVVCEADLKRNVGSLGLQFSFEDAEKTKSLPAAAAANIGRSFSVAVASCDASALLFTWSFGDDRESFAFRNELPLFETMVDDFWLPLLPLASSLSGVEVSVRVKVVLQCPTTSDRTSECSVEDYQTLCYGWLWFLGLPSINPLSSEDELEAESLLRETCDSLLPAKTAQGIVEDLAALQQELLAARRELHALLASEESSFRSSRLKSDPRYQALPTNLHAQLLLRLDPDGRIADAVHGITAGCVSPHSLGHDRGGLYRLEGELADALAKLKVVASRQTETLVEYEISSVAVGRRKLFAVCQSLSIAVCTLYLKIQMFFMGFVSDSVCRSWVEAGFPVVFEGLLSMTNLIGKEKGMVEDCVSAIDALRYGEPVIFRYSTYHAKAVLNLVVPRQRGHTARIHGRAVHKPCVAPNSVSATTSWVFIGACVAVRSHLLQPGHRHCSNARNRQEYRGTEAASGISFDGQGYRQGCERSILQSGSVRNK